jgi:lipopolysaccharide export system protein LptA
MSRTGTVRHLAAGLAIAAWAAAQSHSALAERADRDKPINLEADRVSVDDRNKVAVFEGNVSFVQGTLVIRADRVVVTQDAAGFQKGVATGKPVRFRQKREAVEEFVEGEAERIEHDTRTERTEFFEKASVKSGNDLVRGAYIRYDASSETYLVTSGSNGTVAPYSPGADKRVRVVIQPRRGQAESAPGPARRESPSASLNPSQKE